ncbi:MAG: efflux RND transporter periplasmic adaptor subunit [Planctomycetota bacterium]
MRKSLIGLLLILVVGGVVGVKLLRGRDSDYDLTTATVESRPLTMSVETSGTVEPLARVEVGCEVTGRIIEMAVDNDQPVSKGQVIARIDPELSRTEHEQSKADLLKAQSALTDAKLAHDELVANLPVYTQQALGQKDEAEAALVSAKFNWGRVDDLYKNQNAPEAEWIATKATLMRSEAMLITAKASHQLALNNEKIRVDRATQAIAQADAALQLASARMEFTATRVDRCVIRSPIDGVVLRRFMDVGQTVNATFQTPILFLLAPSLTTMRVNAKIGESDISHIEKGQSARFTLEARQARAFEGKILEKRSQPDIVNNVVTYTVIFEVQNPDGILLPGLSVNVVIECVVKASVPQIPNAILRFKPPITAEERQALANKARESGPPRPTSDANGQPAAYCNETIVWQFDRTAHRWKAVMLWIGITDNVNTEVLAGAKVGDVFVRKYIEKSSGGSGFIDAIKLADPNNRNL